MDECIYTSVFVTVITYDLPPNQNHKSIKTIYIQLHMTSCNAKLYLSLKMDLIRRYPSSKDYHLTTAQEQLSIRLRGINTFVSLAKADSVCLCQSRVI